MTIPEGHDTGIVLCIMPSISDQKQQGPAECCQGYYQNLRKRSTNRTNGSLVTPPNQTRNHHHYHEGFNKSATPLFSNICNCLRDKAKQATTHLGQPFLHASVKLREVTEFFNVLNDSLINYGGYTNFIHFNR